MKKLERRQFIAALLVVIIVAASFSIFFAYQLFKPVPAYEFKTGINHPAVISNWLKNGTVVLFFTENNCPPCGFVAPKIANLQSQYSGTNVTFATINVDDNATSMNIARNYGLTEVPIVLVIRPDGAVATFTMKKVSDSDSYQALDGSGSYSMDFNAIRSAIEEARNGKPSNIFPF
jgi:thiol-disulfide isomerase/thioredoxin